MFAKKFLHLGAENGVMDSFIHNQLSGSGSSGTCWLANCPNKTLIKSSSVIGNLGITMSIIPDHMAIWMQNIQGLGITEYWWVIDAKVLLRSTESYFGWTMYLPDTTGRAIPAWNIEFNNRDGHTLVFLPKNNAYRIGTCSVYNLT